MHNVKRQQGLCIALCVIFLFLCACQKQAYRESTAAVQEPTAYTDMPISAMPTETDAVTACAPQNPLPTPAQQAVPEKTHPAAQKNTEPPPVQQTLPPANAEPVPTRTVFLSVTCQTAIDNGILENPQYQGVVPENGVYFSDTVSFTEGETALEVLKRSLKQQKIVYQISGGYVKSIGGLSEFACGPQSGWLYMVNGEMLSVSSKYYTLHDGDQIAFIYTCKKGDVL